MLKSDAFEYLNPTDAQKVAMAKVRIAFAQCAGSVLVHVPLGPDRDCVIRKLRECAMWANVAITRDEDGAPRKDS